jgi:hypothetical protein
MVAAIVAPRGSLAQGQGHLQYWDEVLEGEVEDLLN